MSTVETEACCGALSCFCFEMANLRRHYTEGMGKSADDVGSEGSYWERALESYV